MSNFWPDGKRCAVTLTYDDAVPVHHEQVAPLLAAHGLTATFYISAHAGFTDNLEPWRRVAALGHELGNHTLFHPCRREPPERYGWLQPHYDLCDYTVQRWTDEVRVLNALLGLVDGRPQRTYGNTCHNTTVGRGEHETSLNPHIARLFVAGRGEGTRKIVDPAAPNFAALGTFGGDGKSFADIRGPIEEARATGGWILWCFHGVGQGTHSGFIATEQHAALVDYLAANRADIWTASLVEVATHLQARAAILRC